jgi:deoxynucleoside triphosphate triphosphohydrolase SAMHD1
VYGHLGRDANKFFLYDIVNNTRSGLDMDKIDYFQRDMKYTNVIFNANFERFIQLARVYPSEPIDRNDRSLAPGSLPMMICYPEKLVREAVDLFRVRFRMHGSVYQHKTVKQVEYMVSIAIST